jgi:cell division protein FtsW
VKRRHDSITAAEQLLLLVTLALVAFGLVMVYSASSGMAILTYDDAQFFLKRDVVYALIGLAAMAALARMDYHRLGALSPLFLGVSFSLMLLVELVGVQVNGATRWLPIGPFTLQPSELAKLSLAIYAAWVLSGSNTPPGDWRAVMRPVGTVTAGLCGLAMLEKDLGSALGLALVAGAVLIAAGASAGAMARVGGVAFGLVGAAIWTESYRRDRLLAFLDPWAHADSTGYQLVQAQYAFGSGGLFGVGPGNGVEKLGRLPEAHTDMIFAIIGEELGLLGVVAVIAAFALLAWAGISIALKAADPFGRRLAAGVIALVAGQAAINFGGVLSILPLTGVPLPLISFGGTSLITTLAGLGLVLSVASHGHRVARVPIEERRAPKRRRPAARPKPKPRPVAAPVEARPAASRARAK